ncbi:unnamed protein product [Gongylonema pulchrum]|uniref:ANF_receptor domain-containing protein n=1 Tax=Gongylonema pulchrum TaxID=637853 RepID=A0A183E961_9BILA|nr:unnamed protein product [Gongylonema pulchrum]
MFLLLLDIAILTGAHDVKVGLLFIGSPELTTTVFHSGRFVNSAAAVLLAEDKLDGEGLVPNVTFNYVWYFDDCESTLTAGYIYKLINEDHVNVILGPTCYEPAIVARTVAQYYNVPLFVWGSTLPSSFAAEDYPNVALVSLTTTTFAKAVFDLMREYRWVDFGFISILERNVKTLPRCDYIQNDLQVLVLMLFLTYASVFGTEK